MMVATKTAVARVKRLSAHGSVPVRWSAATQNCAWSGFLRSAASQKSSKKKSAGKFIPKRLGLSLTIAVRVLGHSEQAGAPLKLSYPPRANGHAAFWEHS